MMEQKREANFGELFVAYLNASITIQRHFLDVAQHPGKADYIRVAIDAMLDLMEVSGLAFLFTELDGLQFRKVVQCAWDLYLTQAADKPQTIRALYAAMESTFSLPVFSPSAMQRQSWRQRLARAMAQRGIYEREDFTSRRPVNQSRGPIIDSVHVMYGHSMDHAYQYFGALYLSVREEAKGIELPHAIENCLQSIEIARERFAETNDETSTEETNDE